ncbi:hypothetical protein BH23THE1_BH23THE1_29210 [soil metagenome]
MAFRIPHRLLSQEHKTRIAKDLCIKEKTEKQYWRKDNHFSNTKGKEIIFYTVDQSTNDILLPMYYASLLFGKALINQRRNFHKIKPFQLNSKLYDFQTEVVNISIRNFMQRGATFLNVFCSFGKTVVAAYFSAIFSQQQGLVTLVVYPRSMIGSSWVGTYRDLTDAKIYIVGETPGPPDHDVQVFLCMDTRLPELDPAIRSKIGHFVIDEAHMFCTAGRVDCLLCLEPLYITILTATYERDDGFHVMLDNLAGPERITRISKKPFFVFQRTTDFEVNPKVGPRGIVFDDLVKQLDEITERNSLIIESVIDNIGEKILILTKHVAHAENLHKWISHYLQPYGKTVALLAGNVSNYSDASVIVGTISKVGVGFDEKKACHDWKGDRINMLILASSTKKIEQIAGRVFRADIPVIIDIVDNNKNTKAHWRERKNWYESRNGVIYSIKQRFSWAQMKENLMSQYLTSIQTGTPISLYQEPAEDSSTDLSKNHASRAAQMWAEMKAKH